MMSVFFYILLWSLKIQRPAENLIVCFPLKDSQELHHFDAMSKTSAF